MAFHLIASSQKGWKCRKNVVQILDKWPPSTLRSIKGKIWLFPSLAKNTTKPFTDICCPCRKLSKISRECTQSKLLDESEKHNWHIVGCEKCWRLAKVAQKPSDWPIPIIQRSRSNVESGQTGKYYFSLIELELAHSCSTS